MPRQDALREYNHYKRYGYCYDLGNLAYDYLVSEGKIPKKSKDPQKGLEYAKKEIVKEYQSDLDIASDKMKKYWQGKIDNLDATIESDTQKRKEGKGVSLLLLKVYNFFKRYEVNEYFSGL